MFYNRNFNQSKWFNFSVVYKAITAPYFQKYFKFKK